MRVTISRKAWNFGLKLMNNPRAGAGGLAALERNLKVQSQSHRFQESAYSSSTSAAALYSTSTTSSSAAEGAQAEADRSELLVQIQNKICTITFNRPDKKNAFNANMFKRFLKGLHEGSGNDNVSLIVVTGSGTHFTSGIDLAGFSRPKKPDDDPPDQQQQQPEKTSSNSKPKGLGMQIILSTFLSIEKPLIALVNGPALGFGVTMLGLFDSVYASQSASFHTQFTKWGLPPEFGSTYTFPNIMGYAKASRILCFNQKISAEEAYEYGLVSELFPAETFREGTEARLNQLAQLPLKSLIYSKGLVRRSPEELELIAKVSEVEQSYFDPATARQVSQEYRARAAAAAAAAQEKK